MTGMCGLSFKGLEGQSSGTGFDLILDGWRELRDPLVGEVADGTAFAVLLSAGACLDSAEPAMQ